MIGSCPIACSESTCPPLCPDLYVALVEAEKTSVICSAVFPKLLWLATGGLGHFNDRVKVLLGHLVIAFPELGACDRWRKKAKDYPLLDITVSDYLEKNATSQQREVGADMAGLVVRRGGRGNNTLILKRSRHFVSDINSYCQFDLK